MHGVLMPSNVQSTHKLQESISSLLAQNGNPFPDGWAKFRLNRLYVFKEEFEWRQLSDEERQDRRRAAISIDRKWDKSPMIGAGHLTRIDYSYAEGVIVVYDLIRDLIRQIEPVSDKFEGYETTEGYIILKHGDDVRFDLGFKEGRHLETKEVNDYLVNGQGKDLDGQPYWAGTQIDEIVLGRKSETIYFVENYNDGNPSPGFYGSKDAITTIQELRTKLAVKEAWKKTSAEPTLRAYRVKADLRVRSGIIGRQSDNGVELPGGGHQYEIVLDNLSGENWRNYLEPIGPLKGVKLEK